MFRQIAQNPAFNADANRALPPATYLRVLTKRHALVAQSVTSTRLARSCQMQNAKSLQQFIEGQQGSDFCGATKRQSPVGPTQTLADCRLFPQVLDFQIQIGNHSDPMLTLSPPPERTLREI